MAYGNLRVVVEYSASSQISNEDVAIARDNMEELKTYLRKKITENGFDTLGVDEVSIKELEVTIDA